MSLYKDVLHQYDNVVLLNGHPVIVRTQYRDSCFQKVTKEKFSESENTESITFTVCGVINFIDVVSRFLASYSDISFLKVPHHLFGVPRKAF